jgi:hypothetical protein
MKMIKQYTAFTKEVDDCEAAVKEILEQFNLEENSAISWNLPA